MKNPLTKYLLLIISLFPALLFAQNTSHDQFLGDFDHLSTLKGEKIAAQMKVYQQDKLFYVKIAQPATALSNFSLDQQTKSKILRGEGLRLKEGRNQSNGLPFLYAFLGNIQNTSDYHMLVISKFGTPNKGVTVSLSKFPSKIPTEIVLATHTNVFKRGGNFIDQAPAYTISDIAFETLTVDSEKDLYNKAIVEVFKDKAEYMGSLKLTYNNGTNGNQVKYDFGFIFTKIATRGVRNDFLSLGLGEKSPLSPPISKSFNVAAGDFETAKLRITGFLSDIDPVFADGETRSPDEKRKAGDVFLQESNQYTEVNLKDLSKGANFIEIARNGRKFRIHFQIKEKY